MENFIKELEKFRAIENESGSPTDQSVQIPYFIQLENFKKEFLQRKSWIEEFMLDGDYDMAKKHLVWIGNEVAKLYAKTEEEKKEAEANEDCGCD